MVPVFAGSTGSVYMPAMMIHLGVIITEITAYIDIMAYFTVIPARTNLVNIVN